MIYIIRVTDGRLYRQAGFSSEAPTHVWAWWNHFINLLAEACRRDEMNLDEATWECWSYDPSL